MALWHRGRSFPPQPWGIHETGSTPVWRSIPGQLRVGGLYVVSGCGGNAIFSGDGGPITTIADASGPFSAFGPASINNLGTVAFVAALDTGAIGIFTGVDPVTDKVIMSGDALDGSTLIALNFFEEGFNDSGQVVFYASFADGRQGIYRADPQAVPEPGTVVLLLAGMAGIAAARRLKRVG